VKGLGGGPWGTLGDLIVKWGIWSGVRPSHSAQARHLRWTTKQPYNTTQHINNTSQTTWKQMVLALVFIHFHSESIVLIYTYKKPSYLRNIGRTVLSSSKPANRPPPKESRIRQPRSRSRFIKCTPKDPASKHSLCNSISTHKQFDFHSVAIHLKYVPLPNHHLVDETPRYVKTRTEENLQARAM
jgi:hypothetical protein